MQTTISAAPEIMSLEEANQQIGSSFDIKPVEPLKWKESSKPGYMIKPVGSSSREKTNPVTTLVYSPWAPGL
jgi:hypothetical protein